MSDRKSEATRNEDKPDSPTVKRNEGTERANMANGKDTKKNYAKRDSYALAFGMISTAIRHNFPLQAIAVEESIISDRIWSALNASKPTGGKKETLGRALEEWTRLMKSGVPFPIGEEAETMRENLVNWWDSRNKLIHGIVKSFRGKEPQIAAANFERSAMKAARTGEELARNSCNWSQKQIRKARKDGAK